MGYPTVEQARIYKSPDIRSQVRVAVGLDYPVFTSPFEDLFPGAALDDTKWFQSKPSWGNITVAGGTVRLSITGSAISPPWIQSRHNLAFPLLRTTDWTFETRVRCPAITGFGVFMRICGRSFRDTEAIWALKFQGSEPKQIVVYAPDTGPAQHEIWSQAVWGPGWMRHRVFYDASAQTYRVDVDTNDDGVYDFGETIAVNGRYPDAIVVGNSTAIQGHLGAWSEIEVDWVRVTGTTETVETPEWAAPFSYDGDRMSYLPVMLGGQVSCDKDNVVDAASVDLDNFGLDTVGRELPRLYTWSRFVNRRGLIEGRAGDGNGRWAPWEVLCDGICAEKQARLEPGGRCSIVLPMRDRRRAQADDIETMACYSDAGVSIPGVGMNLTVAQILADLFQNKAGLPAGAMNIAATPNNKPRNYNVFRQSVLQAAKTLCDHAALCLYQRRSDARIEVGEWYWGTDTPGYQMSTAEEVLALQWTESAFDATSAEQLQMENTNFGDGGFAATWPPHREPFYGRQTHSNSVAVNAAAQLYARLLHAHLWWARNRKLGSVELTAKAQFWVEHNLQIAAVDDLFLGYGRGETFIVDGWTHRWREGEVAETTLRLINAHPDRFLRQALP